MALLNELQKFESILDEINPRLLSKFVKKDMSYTTNKLHTELGFVLPSQCKELYEWRDGIAIENDPIGKLTFGVFGIFSSLEESLSSYEENKSLKVYGEDYFEIFYDDIHLIKLIEADEFVYTIISDGTIQPIFDSIESMFKTINRGFELGYISYTDEVFECDFDNYWLLGKQMNPKSNYWDL